MFDLLPHLIVIGIATALEPVQLVTFIAVLSSTHGLRAGWAFLAGWVVSLLTVTAITWVAAAEVAQYASDVTQRRGVRRATLAIEIILGVGLLAFGLYRIRHHPLHKRESRLSVKGSTLTVTHAAVIGLLIPPWPLVVAGAVDVVRANVGVVRSVVAMLVFIVAATSTLGAMQLWAMKSPESSMRQLARVRAWLEPHSERLISAIALLVGLWLVIHGLRRWH